MPSVPLHTDAETYYREAGYLPSRVPLANRLFDWLSVTWRGLAILVILAAAFKGALEWRREHAAAYVYRKALKQSGDAGREGSVRNLLDLRDNIHSRVRLSWWQVGEIDKSRWRSLHEFINALVSDEKEHLTRMLLAEIRQLERDRDLDEVSRRDKRVSLVNRIWDHLEAGDIDATQHELLIKLLRENAKNDQV